ncbi:hypothetical protein [Pseudophaeobacter profundi]|uniref:hypothetical protein n=1 Tax=Pseudophaeobacter profundi TaxID=3034152 RepID=UPI002430D655|nr:hypothetical protein [Pseudophaeobacter profundi]
MVELLGGLVGLAAAIAALYFILWLFVFLPADMARARRRDPVIWVLISIVGSPLLAILLLIALGDA